MSYFKGAKLRKIFRISAPSPRKPTENAILSDSSATLTARPAFGLAIGGVESNILVI